MLALLILALIGWGLAHRGLVRRIDALEAELAELRLAVRAPALAMAEPVAEPSPPPALRRRLEPASPAPSDAANGEPDRLQPAPERREEEPRPSRFAGLSFEQIVGGRLPIWVGGAALAVAGFYLVGLAIEAGLLAPPVRVALATLFGLGLIAASELAGRWRIIADDARVAQALAGAGIASLYAAAYLASAIYGLISSFAAVALMAGVTTLAIGLALRRGPPTAVMGLVGGFAAPLLATGGDAAVPLLVYLGLLSAGLFALAIRRGWLWLALATTAGSFAWAAALIARDASLAAGAFVLLFAAAACLATPASARAPSALRLALLRGAPVAAGLVTLAGLIPASGFGIEGWALYLALSAGAIGLAWRDARLTPLAAGALALSLAALGGAMGGRQAELPSIGAIGTALLFGGAGHALGRRARDGAWWAGIAAGGLIGPFVLLHLGRESLFRSGGWGVLALVLALAPLHLAWRGRAGARTERPYDRSLQIAAAATALLIAFAATDLLPIRLFPAALALIAAAGIGAGLYVLAKQPFAIRDEPAFVARGFAERAIFTQALFAAGLGARERLPRLAWWLGAVAVARVLWFDLAVLDPAYTAQVIGGWPIANLLTLHFALAAGWTALLWRGAAGNLRTALLAALIAILLGGALLVARQLFHGALMADGPVSRSEFYAYSVAGLATALGLLGWGAAVADRSMRIAALGLLTLVTLKVFLVDASALSGVLRALSFLGLGLALIGIGWAYGRFLGRAKEVPAAGAPGLV